MMRNLSILALIALSVAAAGCNKDELREVAELAEEDISCPKQDGLVTEVKGLPSLVRDNDGNPRTVQKVARCANSLHFYDNQGETTIIHVQANLSNQDEAIRLMDEVVAGKSIKMSKCGRVWWDKPRFGEGPRSDEAAKSKAATKKALEKELEDQDPAVLARTLEELDKFLNPKENPSTEAVCQEIEIVEAEF